MSPTYTMSAHLCKQIYSSWQQYRPSARSTEPKSSQQPSSNTAARYTSSRSVSPEKRSMDSDRSEGSGAPMSRSTSSSSWKNFGGR